MPPVRRLIYAAYFRLRYPGLGYPQRYRGDGGWSGGGGPVFVRGDHDATTPRGECAGHTVSPHTKTSLSSCFSFSSSFADASPCSAFGDRYAGNRYPDAGESDRSRAKRLKSDSCLTFPCGLFADFCRVPSFCRTGMIRRSVLLRVRPRYGLLRFY